MFGLNEGLVMPNFSSLSETALEQSRENRLEGRVVPTPSAGEGGGRRVNPILMGFLDYVNWWGTDSVPLGILRTRKPI